MARIRSIKPDFWEDEKLSDISLQANLLFIGLWNHADDTGIIKSNINWIKSKVFPIREDVRKEQVSQWIESLVNARFLVPFNYNNESYYVIRSFRKHQRIDKPQDSKIPSAVVNTILEQFDDNSKNVTGIFQEHSCLDKERKGEESKRFSRPSLEMVKNYFLEKKSTELEAGKFFNHYSANGWKVGKNSMKDWKAAINQWISRSREFQTEKKTERPNGLTAN